MKGNRIVREYRAYGDKIQRFGGVAGRALLITVAINEPYRQEFEALFMRPMQAYCRRWGYDFLVVDDFIHVGEADPSLISLQKALVCSLDAAQGYERVVFVDADVLINAATAPAILDAAPDPTLAYLTDEFDQPDRESRRSIQERMGWESTATQYYALAGFHLETKAVLNTGVMVLTPEIHGPLLEEAYRQGSNGARAHPRGFHYEQALIGFTLQSLAVHAPLAAEYNTLVPVHLMAAGVNGLEEATSFLERFVPSRHFTHFAAGTQRPFRDLIIRLGEGWRGGSAHD